MPTQAAMKTMSAKMTLLRNFFVRSAGSLRLCFRPKNVPPSGASSGAVLIRYRDALLSALPALAPIGEAWEDSARAAARLPSDPALALAALSRPLGYGAVDSLFRSLKTDNKSRLRASRAVEAYAAGLPDGPASAGLFLVDYGRETALDALSLARKAGSPKAVNIVLMARLAKYLDIPYDNWLEAIGKTVAPKFVELNRAAFALGYEQERK